MMLCYSSIPKEPLNLEPYPSDISDPRSLFAGLHWEVNHSIQRKEVKPITPDKYNLPCVWPIVSGDWRTFWQRHESSVKIRRFTGNAWRLENNLRCTHHEGLQPVYAANDCNKHDEVMLHWTPQTHVFIILSVKWPVHVPQCITFRPKCSQKLPQACASKFKPSLANVHPRALSQWRIQDLSRVDHGERGARVYNMGLGAEPTAGSRAEPPTRFRAEPLAESRAELAVWTARGAESL